MHGCLGFSLMVAAAFPPPPTDPPQYEFVLNVDRLVGIQREDFLLIGKLDKDGEFTHMYKKEASVSADGEKFIFGSGPAYVLLNVGGLKPSKVYEYRSGMLIPGLMRAGGKFIPEEGAKVIRFTDYKYAPHAIPIWNLPGGFVTKEEAAKLKKAKLDEKK